MIQIHAATKLVFILGDDGQQSWRKIDSWGYPMPLGTAALLQVGGAGTKSGLCL